LVAVGMEAHLVKSGKIIKSRVFGDHYRPLFWRLFFLPRFPFLLTFVCYLHRYVAGHNLVIAVYDFKCVFQRF
jgi:hypothetical protein